MVGGWLLPSTVRGGNGIQTTLPVITPGKRITTDWRILIDTEWVDANGYRPVRLEISPLAPGPTKSDRELVVKLYPNSYSKTYTPLEISKTIEIPAGSTSVLATITVPQWQQWHQMRIEVFEDGEEIEDLSEMFGTMRFAANEWTESSPSILFIDADVPVRADRRAILDKARLVGGRDLTSKNLPDVRSVASFFPINNVAGLNYNLAKDADDLDILIAVGMMPRLEMLPPADLPDRSTDYSSFDIFAISLPHLQQMAQQHPDKWQAIRSQVDCGAVLCVYDVGESFERLAELDQTLELPTIDEDDAQYRGWTKADPRLHGKPFDPGAITNIYGAQQLAQPFYNGNASSSASPRKGKEAPPETPPFLLREMNLGRLVAIAAEDPCAGKTTSWMWLFNSLPPRNLKWYQRYGMSMSRENRDYWEFLVPGIGRAPVTSFMVLISVFVIVIGPMNYVVLHRKRRLYLLLVTVPVGAALVTAGLFAYAMMTDGLAARARLRSYTFLDQPRDRALSWSRHSYYAGLTPSQGLKFPLDAEVYCLEQFPKNGYGGQGPARRVDMDGAQTLKSGFVASRTSAQFVVVRATDSQLELRVAEYPAEGVPPKAANYLASTIRKLYLRDSRGDFYTAENVAPEATFELSPITAADAEKEYGEWLYNHRPENPEGYDPTRHNEAFAIGSQGSNWFNRIDVNQTTPTQDTSVLEMNLQGIKRSIESHLSPGSYAAIVDQSQVVPLGIEGARQEASFHVIAGRW